MDIDEEKLRQKFCSVLPILDERQKRILLAAEARQLGRGGVSLCSRLSGLSRVSIHKGLLELDEDLQGKVRTPGAGRKPATETQPELLAALDALVDPDSRGDPMSPLRWTNKSTRSLARALQGQGFAVSHQLVRTLLLEMSYRLQGNRKSREGSSHPDRDAQFKYISSKAKQFLDAGWPVISVDTKKKELVGDFKNGGREYQPQGKPELVRTHDFKDPILGKAIPYGVYDLARNEGWVNIGIDHDTAAFAVESIRRWWYYMGKSSYPDAKQLMICADGGGSNGSRVRLWKLELAKLSRELGLQITVSHFPPGTSKWNKIEHRLFSQITMNWRGRPLTSLEVIVECISATTTTTGLNVKAVVDTASYPSGIKVSDEEFAGLKLRRHKFHGEWNYTVSGFLKRPKV